jgi:hypothetical protein
MEEWQKFLNNTSLQKRKIAEYFMTRMYGSVYEIATETNIPVGVTQSLVDRFRELGMVYVSSYRLSSQGMTPVYGRGSKPNAKLPEKKREKDVCK